MSGSITAWLDLLRDGNEQAATKLWDYFAPNLKSKIAVQCRGLKICDEEDVSTTAFYRLVSVIQDDNRYPVTDRQEFWRLLLRISKNTIGDWRKYDKAACRGGEREILSYDKSIHRPVAEARSDREEVSEADLHKQFEEIAQQINRPEFLQVIELKQQGLTNDKISCEIGLSLRTVQYVIRDIKQTWNAAFGDRTARAA